MELNMYIESKNISIYKKRGGRKKKTFSARAPASVSIIEILAAITSYHASWIKMFVCLIGIYHGALWPNEK